MIWKIWGINTKVKYNELSMDMESILEKHKSKINNILYMKLIIAIIIPWILWSNNINIPKDNLSRVDNNSNDEINGPKVDTPQVTIQAPKAILIGICLLFINFNPCKINNYWYS